MDVALSSILLLDGAVLVVLLTTWRYFRRVRVERPPVGVFNLRDVAFTFVVLVVIPPLYLDLPAWLVASILVVMAAGLAYLTVRSAFGRPAAVVVSGGLAVGEIALISWGYGQSTGFVVVNDIAVGLLVVGVCNIWAQSGIRARDVAVFAVAVAGYDLIATWLTPLMVEFFTQVRSLPFAPMLAVGTGRQAVVLGLGDLLFIVLWPLVAEKAFGGRAGRLAAVGTVGGVVVLGAAFATGLLTVAMPAMVFLGPVILVQYLLLRYRHRAERSMGAYEAATLGTAIRSMPVVPPVADVTAALTLRHSNDRRSGRYLAVHGGSVIGTGTTPGAATMAARKAEPSVIPVLVLDIAE